jgi:phosphoribosylformylglycinamidine synthase subunit PurQ / glutaminase
MMKELKPKVAVLKTDGINCEKELAHAFTIAGGEPEMVHVTELLGNEKRFTDYQILAIPGGFSHGDDIASGKVLANKFLHSFAEQTNDYISGQGLVFGVCNGFQVLVRSGLLPYKEPITSNAQMAATLEHNDSGHFECRWVDLKYETENACVFLRDMDEGVSYQVAHGEGKFIALPVELDRIERERLVVFRYADQTKNPTQAYPQNPNGSQHAIAGITDPSGRILGIMPHPERFITRTQHPNWRRMGEQKPQGLPIFENMVRYAREM